MTVWANQKAAPLREPTKGFQKPRRMAGCRKTGMKYWDGGATTPRKPENEGVTACRRKAGLFSKSPLE